VPSQDEIELLFQRYDKDRDGRLRFSEFSELFIPLDANYANVIANRESFHRLASYQGANPDRVFVPLTLMDFIELWRTHFRVELLAEDLRQSLQANPLFSLENAFEICDLNKDGEVTKAELKQLIESRGFFLSDKEATSLMDKFDKGKHGSITQAEFL